MLCWSCRASPYMWSRVSYVSIFNNFWRRAGAKTYPRRTFLKAPLQCEGWEESLPPFLPSVVSQFAFKWHPCHRNTTLPCRGRRLKNIWLWKIIPEPKSVPTSYFDNFLQTWIPQVEQKAFKEVFFFSLFLVYFSEHSPSVLFSHGNVE